jgi:hypothetical protein
MTTFPIARDHHAHCRRCGRFDPKARPCKCVVERHGRETRHWEELRGAIRGECSTREGSP